MQGISDKARAYPRRDARRNLDSMDFERFGRGLRLFQPDQDTIAKMLDEAGTQITGLATIEKVIEVYRHNPETIFVVAREDGQVSGFIAQLPLTPDGHTALLDGSLDTANPEIRLIAAQHQVPDAVYIWCILVDAGTAGAISLVMERLSSRKYANATLYCRAASEKSRDFFLTLGFEEQERRVGSLMLYRRCTQDTPVVNRPGPRDLTVDVCRTLGDFQMIVAIRAATYIAEHDCPYAEEFDGNDLSGLHLVGHVGSEPAGCIRIRFFAGFAKIERLAVLKTARSSTLASRLIREAIQICRRKGYRHVYGHCESRVSKLWMRHGFRPRTDHPTFTFSDRDYLEGDLWLDAEPEAITPWSDPLVINRPEGRWDQDGVLDKSAERRTGTLRLLARRMRDAEMDKDVAMRGTGV